MRETEICQQAAKSEHYFNKAKTWRALGARKCVFSVVT